MEKYSKTNVSRQLSGVNVCNVLNNRSLTPQRTLELLMTSHRVTVYELSARHVSVKCVFQALKMALRAQSLNRT